MAQKLVITNKTNYATIIIQALGLLVEVLKKRFAKIDAVFPEMKRILSSAVNVLKSGQLVPSGGATVPLWKEAYYSLVLFKKILLEFPERFFSEDSEVLSYDLSQHII